MKKLLLVPVLAFALCACDALDAPSNMTKMKNTTEEMKETTKEMKDTTQEMSDKMDTTNENTSAVKSAIHKQTLLIALDEMSKFENQQLVFPLPTGLMAAGKAFAEEATDTELVELTYLWLRELEEVNPSTGLKDDLSSNDYTDADKAKVRLQKIARLYSLMIIAGFAPDAQDHEACVQKAVTAEDKKACVKDVVTPLIENQIEHSGRHYDSALAFLALRGFFMREVLLKTSLKVDSGNAAVLKTSGMMAEALKYLLKLEFISRLPFADLVSVKIEEKQYNLLAFEEKQDLEGRKATAAIWQVALEKTLAGIKDFSQTTVSTDPVKNQKLFAEEQSAQREIVKTMKEYIHGWQETLL